MSGEQLVTDEVGATIDQCVLKLANTQMNMSLEEWGEISNALLGVSVAHRATEAKLKTVLDREAATIKRHEDKLDEAEAERRITEAQLNSALLDARDYQARAVEAEAKLRAATDEVERLKVDNDGLTKHMDDCVQDRMDEMSVEAADFDKDVWRALCSYLKNSKGFSWNDYDDGIHAEDVIEFLREADRTAESVLAATKAELTAALAEVERLKGDIEDLGVDMAGMHVALEERESALAEAKAKLEAAWVAHFNEAARIASTWCLVPPDGGSPSEEEAELCNTLAAHFRSLAALTTKEAPDATR